MSFEYQKLTEVVVPEVISRHGRSARTADFIMDFIASYQKLWLNSPSVREIAVAVQMWSRSVALGRHHTFSTSQVNSYIYKLINSGLIDKPGNIVGRLMVVTESGWKKWESYRITSPNK